MQVWKKGRAAPAVMVTVIAALALAACGSDQKSSTSSSGSESEVVSQAKQKLKEAQAPVTKWTGPTTGPKASTGKSIVCIMNAGTDAGAIQWCRGVSEAAKAIGWNATILDGKGVPNTTQSAILQAINSKADGIVLGSVDAEGQKGTLKQAAAAGIAIVGIHSAAFPGKQDPSLNLFTNLSTKEPSRPIRPSLCRTGRAASSTSVMTRMPCHAPRQMRSRPR